MRLFRNNNYDKYAIGVTCLLYLLQLTLLPIGHVILHVEDSDQDHKNCAPEHTHTLDFTSDCRGPCQNPDHDHDRHSDTSHSSENCSVCKTLVLFATAKDFDRYVDIARSGTNPVIDNQILFSQNVSFHSLSRGPPISSS